MRLTRALALMLMIVVGVARAYAADGAMAITGTAVDAQGLALPGVTVTLKAAASQSDPQEQITDADGHFTFDDLAAGSYSVALSLSGFETSTFDAVTVPGSSELKAVLKLAGFTETVVVRAEAHELLPVAPIGEAVFEQSVLQDVPLANDQVQDALPLLPGVVRGPDGLLNMNGARADQSAFLMNGVNMTDPVTGHFSARLPLEAIETMNVHGGTYSAAFGNATGGVTDIVIKPGQDKFDFQVQNMMPRLRFHNGIEGFDSFTPRVRFSGPIQSGRIWFSQAMSYRFVRTQVEELSPRGEDEQKVKSFDSVTQIDAKMTEAHHLTATFIAFPSNIDNAGIDTLHPYAATADLKQRAWLAALSERAVLSDTTTLTTSAAMKQYDMNVASKNDDMAFVTITGFRNDYFNHFDRDSRRYDASMTLAITTPNAWGQHLTRTGGQLAHTSYEGIDASRSVIVTGANGATLRRIDYIGTGYVGESNTEIAGFIDDQWFLSPQLSIHAGARYGYEQIAGQQTIAPRVDASYQPFASGRTIVKAGYGQFYDKLALNAADFADQQSRRITEYDAEGNATGVTMMTNRVSDEGLRTPTSTAWNVELDQTIAGALLARVGYRRTRGSDQLIVDPTSDGSTLRLSSEGRSASHEFEATIRRSFKTAGHVNASYVRSSAKSDLNDFVSIFGDLRDPIIRADEYARQSFDVPNRFLVWGVMNLPREIVVAPTVEYRNGFPYTVVDERQNVVGERNAAGRYPNLFTLDLAVTKDVQLTKARRARVGVQFFNLTNHFNPQDVQNNTSSPYYGTFANSVDRQIRTKFTLLF